MAKASVLRPDSAADVRATASGRRMPQMPGIRKRQTKKKVVPV